jgi:PAS domain-containing protein
MEPSNPGVPLTKLILRLERLTAAEPAEEQSPAPARHVVDLGDRLRQPAATSTLARWIATVAAAHDACVVLDADGKVASISAGAAELLGCGDTAVVGRPLLEVIELVDFDTGGARPDYAPRIAPVAVLGNGSGLVRSLIRLRRADGGRLTIDASAAPIHDARGETVGSFTFLAPVRG